MIDQCNPIPTCSLPQAFVKAAWKPDGRIAAIVSGNLDAEPKVIQADVLRSMLHAVECELERLGIPY